MRANQRQRPYRDWVLRPHHRRDVSERHQSTTVLGHKVETPILLAAAGLRRGACRTGELGVARAAAQCLRLDRGRNVELLQWAADAVLAGRPYRYGMAANGEVDVSKGLDILKQETSIALGLTGCANISELSWESISRAGAAEARIGATRR